MPILAGYDYQGILKKGDSYIDDMTNCKYRIEGFLPKGYKLPSDSLFYSDSIYENMDKSMLAVYEDRIDPLGGMTANYTNSIYLVTDGSEEAINNVKRLAEDYFIHMEIGSIEDLIQDSKDNAKDYFAMTALFTGIALLSGIIAMISSAVVQIVLRKREYGILYANGVSKYDTMRLVALENGIIQGISFLITSLYMRHHVEAIAFRNPEINIYVYTQMTFCKSLCIMAVLFVISVWIPIRMLSRLKTTELLGGNEL